MKLSLIVAFIIMWSLEKYFIQLPTLGGSLGLYTHRDKVLLQRSALIGAFILLWILL